MSFILILFVAWQTRFMLGLIDFLLIIVSIAHAWLLWLYVGQMRKTLEQLGEQYGMSEIKRRKFGFSGRDVYRHRSILTSRFSATSVPSLGKISSYTVTTYSIETRCIGKYVLRPYFRTNVHSTLYVIDLCLFNAILFGIFSIIR